MQINERIFKSDIEKIKNILNKIDLLRNSDFYKKRISNSYRVDGTKEFNKIFQSILENNDFHFLLKDQSIIQIEKSDNTLRYTFWGSPFMFLSYEDYLFDKGLSFSDVGYSYQEEYNQKLYESDLIKFPVYISYDYSEDTYKEFCHGTSHIHIGLYSDMRISSCMELTPLSFLMIILKNFYYNVWKEIVEKPKISREFESVKANCPDLPNSLFSARDKKELYII